MSIENPYQSPENAPTPELDAPSELVFRKYPTWRLWVLIVTCVPLFVVGYFAAEVAFDYREIYPLGYFAIILSAALLLGLIIAIALIVFTWHAPSQAQQTDDSEKSQSIFLGALWFLGLLAAPSALMSICTPTLAVTDLVLKSYNPLLSWGAGLTAGAFGIWLVIKLARGLWQDAIGRPKRRP